MATAVSHLNIHSAHNLMITRNFLGLDTFVGKKPDIVKDKDQKVFF